MKCSVTKRSIAPAAGLALLLLCGAAGVATAATDNTMYKYCQVPPYVVQNIAPNIMLLVSNSRSMLKFAYAPEGETCSDTPCGGFQSGTAYYGYFDPGAYYVYNAGGTRFVQSARKRDANGNERAKSPEEWDGNFLNWLTMRRIDVLRRALTGGPASGGNIDAQQADDSSRGIKKSLEGSEPYIPSDIHGNLDPDKNWVTFSTGSINNISTFTVQKMSGTDTFRVRVASGTAVEGVLQSVVGTRARLGLTFYTSDSEGGNIEPSVGSTSLPSLVNRINTPSNMNTGSSAPLAEALWSIAGYFAREHTLNGMDMSGGCISGSNCGPRYHNVDYVTNSDAKDPYNFGTGGGTRYPRCARSYVILITDGEPCADGNLPQYLDDYALGLNTNCTGDQCGSLPSHPLLFPAQTIPSCPLDGNVAGIEDVALYVHTEDLRSDSVGFNNILGKQNLTLYVIQAFGSGTTGSTLLKYAAINGSFEDRNGSETPDIPSEWDENGDGWPDTYYFTKDGASLERALRDAFSGLLKRASSGTAASVLASGEGSGANLVQAVFYPRRRFGNDIISWVGSLQNLWYYVDPFFANSSIREDTVADDILDLRYDRIAQLYFDTVSDTTMARLFEDANGDGAADGAAADPIPLESVSSLWEAGRVLYDRDLSATPHRNIFTSLGGTTLTPFTDNSASALASSLNAASAAEAGLIIRYIRGEDIFIDADNDNVSDLRSRTVTIGGTTSVWRLGDIVNSTPRISSWLPLNTYYKVYNDPTYDAFTKTTEYKNRGMVFTGGNDGMLHAFKLGKLELEWAGQQKPYQKARLSLGTDTAPLGQEVWAFIPRNTLPYLKYQMETDYCHTYTVDLTSFVFDASIGREPADASYYDHVKAGTDNTWRTILIGGMRTGGACRNAGSTESDTVAAPVSGLGYSSYFALDVTDQSNPTLLWEFSNPGLGFATTGPAIVRISARTGSPGQPDPTKNGHWYVVLGSGPTGPIDITYSQFMGRSRQPLRLFVLDLPTGQLLRTIDNVASGTSINNAFVGSLYNASTDTDTDYQDDAVYFGYTKSLSGTAGSNTWTEGGVGRLLTHADPDVNTWTTSIVIDGTGPITSAVARLRNRTLGQLWLFFGAGRYFFEMDSSNLDDPVNRRKLFGIKEPCYSVTHLDPTCGTTVPIGDLTDVTSLSNVPTESTANGSGFKGWFLSLDPSSTIGTTSTYFNHDNILLPYRAERVITDPVATGSGAVFFTTYKPYADECGLGGKSFLWGLRYNTGGAPGTLLKGKALVQVSTAAVEQINLQSAFGGADSRGGRRSAAMEGVPPTAQGLSLIAPPPPIRRVLHMRER